MSEAHKHDPVSAIAEAEAAGRTAEIFTEIREVMQLPLVTSIWRTLEGIDGGLETTWAAARPIYESGQPDALLKKLRAEWKLPIPEPLSTKQLESVGIHSRDREAIFSILRAYNRSNTLNLIALTALVRRPKEPHSSYPLPKPLEPWPPLYPLLEKGEISPSKWVTLERTKYLGTPLSNSALPTLWRHLIHWPGLIELILERYESLQQNGSLFQAIERTTEFVESKAPALSNFRDASIEIPEEARLMVESYVGPQPSVSRMATLGHSVSRWLSTCGWVSR